MSLSVGNGESTGMSPSNGTQRQPFALDITGMDERSSAGMRKELDMRLTAYLPAVVRRHLEKQDMQKEQIVPDTHQTTVVSMFADVSGFTAMTESLAARGPVGAEFLGKHLNSYFEQLLRLVSSAGGDVFKFAGDAMLIFWPENKEDTLESLLRRSIQCALRIQSHLHKAELAPGVVLSVKMGIGIGGATIAHLGGVSDGSIPRIEYIAVGPALEQAFNSEHQAEAGDVICSPECWKMIHKFFEGEAVQPGSDFHKVTQVISPIKLCSRRPSFTRDDALLHSRMKQYVSRAVWPYLDAHDEFWGSELRDVTVLFINLGFCDEDLAKLLDVTGLQKLQSAFALVQKCIYEYEGTINKFLVDDKGSTVIAAFGLPPVTHENDPIRGILSSLAICAELGKLGLKASVGITTGTALCGVVGHQGNRREYTVLGDIVNLSARLMQKAKSEKGGVITDETTKLFTQDVLHFEERPEIMVKGKNDSIKIHRPYPRMSILLEFHLSSTSRGYHRGRAYPGGTNATGARATPIIQNVMENMHRVQVRDAQRRLSMRAEEQSINSDGIIEGDSFCKVRDALIEKCSRLNRFSPGGSFILEGDIGVGKTALLRSALSSPEAGSYNVLQGTTTPYATRKPYAIWAEIISKCALERGSSPSISSCVQTDELSPLRSPSGTMINLTATGLNDFAREAERRKQIAVFVRRKIKEGAAPNTTLVGYAHLLNSILDTNFQEFSDEDGEDIGGRFSSCSRSIKLLEKDLLDNNGGEDRESVEIKTNDTNQDENRNTESYHHYADSPTKLKVKTEEIAAWFLGLLEMDLSMNQRQSDEFRLITPVRSEQNGNESSTVFECEDEDKESEWKPTDLDMSGVLLLCALHAMSRNKSTIFCLDNAMYMDEKSWILATIIAKYFTNCLVVVGTRPPSLALNENTESSSFRKRLRVLKRMRSSVSQSLEPLTGTETEQLARQILNVEDIPGELMAILLSRSQGNPLFLREIVAEMKHQQVIKVDEKHRTCRMQVQEPWGEKSSANFCFYCHGKFASSKEKHRCKSCGYVFCNPCTPKACYRKLPGSTGDPVRHCCGCYTMSATKVPSSDRSLAAAVGAATAGASTKTPALGRHKSRMRSIFLPGSDSHGVTGASLKNRIALRPPRTVKSVLTTLLDQLTISQRMLMKTASVIGSTFEEELLRGSCPIKAHISRFAVDIDELERLAMIRRVDPFIGGVPGINKSPSNVDSASRSANVKVKFEFCHGFMQDVIRSQMLCSQLDKLHSRITDFREQQQKELRHKFFEKANGSLNHRPMALSISNTGVNDRRRGSPSSRSNHTGNGAAHTKTVMRAITPTKRGTKSKEDALSEAMYLGSMAESSTSSTGSSTQVLNEDYCLAGYSPSKTPETLRSQPAFIKLKSGSVYVKKQSSLLSHFKIKGLRNARLWKKRYAVLQNARLVLQHDEADQQSRQCTSLFLKGAKVSACDPEVAAKVNCFQVEVNAWTKGKYLMNQRRTFLVGVENEVEVENWVYMIRYAIEAFENQAD